MKGDAEVLDLLNGVLTNELTAINQYFIHSKMCEDWGYHRLAHRHRHESIEEMKHADRVISRILLLEGVPNMQRLHSVRVGETVPEQLDCDLALEMEAVELLNRAIGVCRDKRDNGTRELFESILVEEEEGIDWIEAQQKVIADIGIERYLSQQMHDGG